VIGVESETAGTAEGGCPTNFIYAFAIDQYHLIEEDVAAHIHLK